MYKYLIAAALLCTPSIAAAQTTYHLGIGIGPEYGGLGATGERITDTSRLALGGGFLGRSSFNNDRAYGVGLTYHRFDLIQPESGRHALGVGIVPAASYNWATFEVREDGRTVLSDVERRVAYGAYVGYNYHPRGAQLGGAQIGIGYTYGRRDGIQHGGVSITLGYRFN